MKKGFLLLLLASPSLHAMEDESSVLLQDGVTFGGTFYANKEEHALLNFPGNIPTNAMQEYAYLKRIEDKSKENMQASQEVVHYYKNMFFNKWTGLFVAYSIDQQIAPLMLKNGTICCIPGDWICKLLYPGHEEYQLKPCEPAKND